MKIDALQFECCVKTGSRLRGFSNNIKRLDQHVITNCKKKSVEFTVE